jgi:phage terminase small subunit
MSGGKLTPKQARFVKEYLIDLNATQAAIRAGYSAKTAKAQGSRLLTNADVQAAVARGQEKAAAKLDLSQEMVLNGLLAETRLTTEDNGPSSARIRAWELLGKHQGMFVERSEHTLKGVAINIRK